MRLKSGKYGAAANISIALLALAFSFLTAAAARPAIVRRVMAKQMESARAAAERLPSFFHAEAEKRAKMSFTPFGVPDEDPSKSDKPDEDDPIGGDIKNFKLTGTLPPAGAWVSSDGGTSFLLKGRLFDGYKLETVEPGYAVFTKDGEKHRLYLLYRSAGEAGNPATPPPQVNQGPVADPASNPQFPANSAGIVQSGVNGEDGAITRETLNELLMNPLAEIGKMRLVPTEDGMRIMDMRSDALFGKLGMRPDDVIKSVNGIAINDVGNVSNVITSMMSGARFDFEVERGGSPLKLGYAVK